MPFGHMIEQLKPRIFDFLYQVATITSSRDIVRFPELRLEKVGTVGSFLSFLNYCSHLDEIFAAKSWDKKEKKTLMAFLASVHRERTKRGQSHWFYFFAFFAWKSGQNVWEILAHLLTFSNVTSGKRPVSRLEVIVATQVRISQICGLSCSTRWPNGITIRMILKNFY